MENYLKIENLNVLNIIKDFNLVIKDKGIYSIVGKSSSGKTLLTKTFAVVLPISNERPVWCSEKPGFKTYFST